MGSASVTQATTVELEVGDLLYAFRIYLYSGSQS